MTTQNPQFRMLSKRGLLAAVVVLFALAGCKSRQGSTGGVSNGNGKFRDPLVYGPSRIPPQNVPLPDRDGTARGSDPLVSPTSRTDSQSGARYSDDPNRFKGSFHPGANTTPAALAASRGDGEELKIADADNRVPLRQVGGVLPPGESAPIAEEKPDALLAALKRYGISPADQRMEREEGKYVFRASVPIGPTGARRQYQGIGATAEDAMKQVVDQIATDPDRK